MTADELARQALTAARRGGKPITWASMVRGEIDPATWEAFMRRQLENLPPLPADQLAAIERGAPALPRSADGWTLPDDPELDALFERINP